MLLHNAEIGDEAYDFVLESQHGGVRDSNWKLHVSQTEAQEEIDN